MRSLPNAEQETSITFGREDDMASIWTSDKTVMNKLDKFVENEDSPWKCIDVGKNEEYGVLCKEYKCPKGLISFKPKKRVVNMTEEDKQRIAERLRSSREKQKYNTLEDN